MAKEHLGPQLNKVHESTRPPKPLEGTDKHPQGRLFAPVGMNEGDPWKLSPENWMQQPAEGDKAAHADVIAWHSSNYSQPPRFDDASQRQLDEHEYAGADWDNHEHDPETGEPNPDFQDFSVDKKGRPMAYYGSAVGMHMGNVHAAIDVDRRREHLHPLRIPADVLAPPPAGNFMTERPGNSIAAGSMRSMQRIYNAETGEGTEDTRWSDQAVNFASKATDLVASGKALAYRNDIESSGSTSYRALPETTRTWSEDVLGALKTGDKTQPSVPGQSPDTTSGFRNTPHPALVHLAQLGYNPVQQRSELPPQEWHEGVTTTNSRRNAFEQGKAWRLQKPKDKDAF